MQDFSAFTNQHSLETSVDVMISQSNYIPWKGFFDAINSVDIYVVYDEVQYTRRDWRNRNKVKSPQGPTWLTIPVDVKGKYTQKISETRVSDPSWTKQHWTTLKHLYSKAPFFKDYSDTFEKLYQEASQLEYLSEINLLFLQRICALLNINTKFIKSSSLPLEEGRNERILGICKTLNTTQYNSGPSAKGYIDEELFLKENIKINYFNFSNYPEYDQLYPPFEHAVSVLDTIFMLGPKTSDFVFKNISPKSSLNLDSAEGI